MEKREIFTVEEEEFSLGVHPLVSGILRWRWRQAAQQAAGEAQVERREQCCFRTQVHL